MPDCPECNSFYRGGKCKCGWREPQAPDWVTEAGKPKIACEGCGEGFTFWTSLTPGDDGIKRCATCHIAYLKQRMVADPAPSAVIAEAKATLRRLFERVEGEASR